MYRAPRLFDFLRGILIVNCALTAVRFACAGPDGETVVGTAVADGCPAQAVRNAAQTKIAPYLRAKFEFMAGIFFADLAGTSRARPCSVA
jgi:hypothetical protein